MRLRIGNLAKAVLVTGQAYQDPKDALNEFVSNAADEYAELDRRGGRIRVVLRRRGAHPLIAVDDTGRGMSPDRLREVARSLFESSKAGDDRTLGEKAIGILAFQQLGGRCEVVSRAEDSDETWTLTLRRGEATAALGRERRSSRARQVPGTTVYLGDLDPEVLRMLTQRKVVDYLRVRRGAALANGDYELEVVEGKRSELVTPEKPEGIKLHLPARHTLWGRIEFSLYVAPPGGGRRRVSVVGRAGTTIIDDLAELEELDGPPWSTDRVSGQVAFAALQQSAGRRAILRDREAFPVFLDALAAVEPAVTRTLERLDRELDEQTADRLNDAVRRIFSRVLKELADLDNPMRAPVGDNPGEGGLLDADRGEAGGGEEDPEWPPGAGESPEGAGPGIPEREPPPLAGLGDSQPLGETPPPTDPEPAQPDARRRRSGDLPSLEADPTPGEDRSRFDADRGVVLFNDRHGDYLLVKEDERALLDYLATLVAKEYVLYNNPLAAPPELAEEMVRMLVRVRRHAGRR